MMKKCLKKNNQLRYKNFLVYLKIYNYFKNTSQEFRLNNINGTIDYFPEEGEKHKTMNKTHRKLCTTLNYIEHVLILVSTFTRFVNFWM